MKSICQLFLLLNFFFALNAQGNSDYTNYHSRILQIEILIANENYSDALDKLENTFQSYEFVFLKDIQIATQLAVHLQKNELAFSLLEKGVQSGWTIKEIKKNRFLAPLKKKPQWKKLIKSYPSLKELFTKSIDQKLKEDVKNLYKSDQKLAWGYLFRIGQKAKEKFANTKVKPNAINQIEKLNHIIDNAGYPGEKLIGEPEWMSTILSHHNSLSEDFVKSDTLYDNLRTRLLSAIKKGELNPYVFAIIEDWRIAVKYDRQKSGFGYIEHLKHDQIQASDHLREQIGIRSIVLRNQLVDIQEKTGMNFYLSGSGWVEGKIGG